MNLTHFTELPDLVILDILRYLSPFDAIQSFYNTTDRILNLLIETRCFSSIHQLRLPLFNFVCERVLPRIGAKLSHITLYDHQLSLIRQNQILSYLSNLSSIHLINLIEITENDNILSYLLNKKVENLIIEFVSEHRIEAQAYICEQFIFNKKSENLIHCQLLNKYGIQLKHLNLFRNNSMEYLKIQLKQLSDLHVLLDNLSNIKILDVELCRWTIEDIKYDYTKLSKKLPYLTEFSLQIEHSLSFNQLLTILQHLIHLKKLSFLYRNYDEHGIDITQFELIINNLHYLIQFHFIIKFIYFNLKKNLTFENNLEFKQKWNIHTYNNPLYKNYLAYTQPFIQKNYSISTDILLNDELKDFPTVTNLNLTTHTKQLSILSIIYLLNNHFPSLTNLHVVDSFGVEENDEWNCKLPKIHSFNASELKNSNLFQILFQSMPNLNYLYINSNILNNSNLKSILRKNKIKHLELITNHFDEIKDILIYFPLLEQFIVNTRKQSNQNKRKPIQIVFDWFDICPKLYTIYVEAFKLSELFYLLRIDSDESRHVHYSNEILTIWR